MSAAQQQHGAGFDAIAMEVFSNRLLSITEDMALNIQRASFSTQIKERRDFSVGLFDENGRLIAQGTHVPLHLGSLLGSMEAVLARFRPDEVREGDAYICNDAYVAGGTHLPDISIVTPIFIDGVLIGFAANIAHHSDVGGSVAGSVSADARSIFEEGLRIPLIRVMRNFEVDEDVLALVSLNSRLPVERTLDLRVQIATNDRGASAFRALVQRMGIDRARDAIRDLLAYTQRRLKARVAELADGDASYTCWLDDDGIDGEAQPITATVRVNGDALVIDLTGSAPQTRGALNMTRSAVHATVYYAIKALLDPELLPNSGMFDAITVIRPEGSISNPRHPAPVGARSVACQKLAGTIFGAFRSLLPAERQMASGNDTQSALRFAGYRPDGTYYVAAETLGGGSGARFDRDGMNGVHVHVTNTLNLPVESWENEFPLLVDAYELTVDSGGAGAFRGGLSISRRVRTLHGLTDFSSFSDGHKRGSDGINGGLDGGFGRLIANEATEPVSYSSKVAGVFMQPGETIRICTPGGGGFGKPEDRPLQAIADDLFDGYITREAAERDYGADRVAAALALIGAANG